MDNEKQPSTVDFALIERLGLNRVADALDLSAGAVRRWRSRGVPKERHAAITKLAGIEGQLAADHTDTGQHDSETARLAMRNNEAPRSTSDKRETNDVHGHSPDAGAYVRLCRHGHRGAGHAAGLRSDGMQTKKPVRLNRKTVMIVGAGLASALVVGFANGTIQNDGASSSLKGDVEDREPIYQPLGTAYLPAFDYTNLPKQAALPVITESPEEPEPAPEPEPQIVTEARVITPVRDQRSKEEEAALQSPLFPKGVTASRPNTTLASAGHAASNDPTLAALNRLRDSLPTPQDLYPQSQRQASSTSGQEDFLNARLDDAIYLKNGLQKPLSDFEIKAGTMIPAALITGLNSDLPGEIIGQVTEHVFDTRSGQHLLIPQGTKIIGRYNADIGYGQDRAQIIWDRLIMPNGNSTQLEAMVGTDKAGYAGLSDRVDHHLGRLVGAVILSSFISVGANLATDGGNDITDALGDAAAQQAAQVGSQIVDRQLDVRPTITARPGFRLNILVGKDVILQPYHAE